MASLLRKGAKVEPPPTVATGPPTRGWPCPAARRRGARGGTGARWARAGYGSRTASTGTVTRIEFGGKFDIVGITLAGNSNRQDQRAARSLRLQL